MTEKTEKTQRPIDLMRGALKSKTVEVIIDLPGYGPAMLTYADGMDVYQEQERSRDLKVVEYTDRGYDDKPISERKWKRYLTRIDYDKLTPERKKRILDEKPANLAEQMADEDTQFVIVRELVPKYLRDATTRKQLFLDEASQREFGDFAITVPDLRDLVIKKFTELFDRVDKLRVTAKNSSKQDNSENGDSVTKSEDDTK